ncbi:MAG: type II secretion system F family protein [Gilvibacter sp.]
MSISLSKISTQQTGKKARLKKDFSFNWMPAFNNKRKTQFYKDFAMLLAAQVDFRTALTILSEQQSNAKTKEIIDHILLDVVAGKMFFQAAKDTGAFTDYEIFSLKIGEETRKLAEVLTALQAYYEKKVALRKQIISMLTYPAFVLGLTLLTLYFMLSYVVPLFGSVFNQFNKELPPLTKFVIALSEKFNLIFLGFVLLVAVIVLGYRAVKNNLRFRAMQARFLLAIPFFGKLIREIYLTRFCQAMALLLLAKTSIVASIEMAQKIVGFYPLEKALIAAQDDLMHGLSLSQSMKKHKIFDHQILSMVSVAEQVNQLDTMFETLAKQYNTEVEHKTKMMGSVIEPLLIVFIGSIVGLIMIAMYAPMFNLSEVIGGQ